MNIIDTILADFPVFILDGALATELERRGCDINNALWSAKILAENPDAIGAVHADYFTAGADCAITASYQATIEGFVKKGFTEAQADSLIRSSVRIAKRARDTFWENPDNRTGRPKPLVAGSVGPYGAYLADGSEYRGDYSLDAQGLLDFHRSRIKILTEEGADILACETIPSFVEAKALVKLLEEFPHIHCWMSFSAKNGMQICDGTPISDCAHYLDACAQVAAIGINCTAPQHIVSLIGEIKNNTRKPVVVYPNSGEEYDAQTKTWHGDASGKSFGRAAKDWFDAGAQLIGGCCRTTPNDIRAIAAWARNP